MPNLIERRRIKKQQMSATQSPVYNIYYTDSVPIQQLPNCTRYLAKSFPRVNQTSSSRTRRQPKTNGFFRRTRNFARGKKYSSAAPFFPEEEQRRRMEQYVMSRAQPPTIEIFKNYQQPICSEQLNSLNYHSNQSPNDYILPNYEFHYKNSWHTADTLECSKSYQQMLCTERIGSFNNCATSLDLNTKNNQISVSRLDTSNQLVTVPNQPVTSDNGYSTNIEVLAQPLKCKEVREENANKTIDEKSQQSLDGNDTIREFLKEEASGPSPGTGDKIVNGETIREDVLTTSCSFFNKKRMSLLRKLSARIRRNKTKPVPKVSRSLQTSTCPVSELTKFENVQSTEFLTFKIQSDNSNLLDAQSNQLPLRKLAKSREAILLSMNDDVRSFAYSAQEILSPRQMISSMTNVCSEKRDAESHLRMSEREREYRGKTTNAKSNYSIAGNFGIGEISSFQDIADKLENTLSRSGVITNAERKLLDDILDQHGTKSEVDEIYNETFMENEKNENFHFENDILIQDTQDEETTKTEGKDAASYRKHGHKKYKNSKRTQSQIEKQPTVVKENSRCTASMISFVCESCKLRNQGKEKEESNPCLVIDSNKLYKQKHNCPKEYVQSDYATLNSTNNIKSSSKNFESSKNCRHDGVINHLNDCSKNSLRRYNDNLPSESNQTARPYSEQNSNYHLNMHPSAPHYQVDNKNNANGIYAENQNLTCCGLVMYGQKDSSPSTIRSHCCNRTIPVCGTVSQGMSPRYQPNFMPPPYHEQDPHWLQHSQHRQRYNDNHRCEQENLRDHRHHCDRDLRRQFYGFDDGDGDDPRSNLEFSPPFVLRSLARAANIILTSIFGRAAVRTPNRTEHRQQHCRSNRHDSLLTIRDRTVNREGMCCRRNSENFQETRRMQHPLRH